MINLGTVQGIAEVVDRFKRRKEEEISRRFGEGRSPEQLDVELALVKDERYDIAARSRDLDSGAAKVGLVYMGVSIGLAGLVLFWVAKNMPDSKSKGGG